MKKLLQIAVLAIISSQLVFGEHIFNIDPLYTTEKALKGEARANLEEKWKIAGNDPAELSTSKNFTYSCPDGIGGIADSIYPEVKALIDQGKTDIIIVGFSEAGLAARRMIQTMPEQYRSKIKGLITMGTPQAGSRLANQEWAWTVTAASAAYGLLTAVSTIESIVFAGTVYALSPRTLSSMSLKTLPVCIEGRGEALEHAGTILTSLEKIREGRISGKLRGRPLSEIGAEYGLPFVDSLIGSSSLQTRFMDLVSAALLAPANNSVRQMNPGSSFLQDLNSKGNVAIEKSVPRASIMNRNGDIYDTFVWESVDPVLRTLSATRDTLLTKAARNFWNPAVVMTCLSAAASLSVNYVLIGNVNNLFSWTHTGEWGNHKDHEVLVPYNDEFRGYSLNEELREYDSSRDRHFTNDKVSHLDIMQPYEKLVKQRGKSGSRKGAAEQLIKSMKDSHNHVFYTR